jgi:hypothetical protein
MTIQQQLEQFREHVTKALRKIPDSRYYALDERALDSLAAFGIAWQEQRAANGKNFDTDAFTEVISELCKHIPSLMQRRVSESTPMPKVWTDPVTSAQLPSPFDLKDDAARLRATTVLAKHDPDLLAHFQAMRADPYKHVQSLRDAEAKRLQLEGVKYGEDEHKVNVFVNGTLDERARFTKENPAEVVEVYKAEAQPVKIPWTPGSRNLSEEGRLLREAPHIAALAARAANIQRTIIETKLAEAREAEKAAQRERQSAEAMLSGKERPVSHIIHTPETV